MVRTPAPFAVGVRSATGAARGAGEHHVTVGAAETEAGDTGINGLRRQLHRFGQHPQSAVGEPKLFVLCVGEARRRGNAMVQAEHDLDQTGDTRCALGVAQLP